MSRTHKPQRGDKVNDTRRIPNANGFVVRILYDEGPSEVVVKFDDGTETYDYSEFEYSWTDKYGGVFEVG
jgi:hypothetical protein